LGEGVEMEFAWIPPGSFLMGSPPDEEGQLDDETQHRVTLTRGFWLGITPVTQAQWQAVPGGQVSHCQGEGRPVEGVSWDDCQAFCKALGPRYRLPTETEWEYACRAGTTTAYCSGDGLEALKKVGWCSYDGNQGSAKETRPVGRFQPNAWGLYDPHGNVWEWCADGYGPYPDGDAKDPRGADKGDWRVLRGGSWFNDPGFCRSASRGWDAPNNGLLFFGFRVVLCPG
jgi:formylglycine-generating enzyme required for sulfatase activity